MTNVEAAHIQDALALTVIVDRAIDAPTYLSLASGFFTNMQSLRVPVDDAFVRLAEANGVLATSTDGTGMRTKFLRNMARIERLSATIRSFNDLY